MRTSDVKLGQLVRVKYGVGTIACKVYKYIEQTHEWGLRKVRSKHDDDFYYPRVSGVVDYFATADKFDLVGLGSTRVNHSDPGVVWADPIVTIGGGG